MYRYIVLYYYFKASNSSAFFIVETPEIPFSLAISLNSATVILDKSVVSSFTSTFFSSFLAVYFFSALAEAFCATTLPANPASAILTISVNALGLSIAISDNILRLISTPAFESPLMNFE